MKMKKSMNIALVAASLAISGLAAAQEGNYCGQNYFQVKDIVDRADILDTSPKTGLRFSFKLEPVMIVEDFNCTSARVYKETGGKYELMQHDEPGRYFIQKKVFIYH